MIFKFFKVIIGIVSLVGISVYFIKYYSDYPYLYVCLLWLIFCATVVIFSPKKKIRLQAIYLGSLIIAFGLAEAHFAGFFSFGSQRRVIRVERKVIRGGFNQNHPLLGYAPVKNGQLSVKKYFGDTLMYDIIQTIDQNGCRITPANLSGTKSAVLFLGNSFTFGEGVQDEESMPYRFQEAAKGEFKTFNFGYGGYGPHQMLALFEKELEKEVISGFNPQAAIYQLLPDHIYRCTGKSGWDFHGPKYRLLENGELVYRGSFHNYFTANFMVMLSKSHTLRRIFFARPKITSADVDLMVQIIKKLESTFVGRYNGKFIVLLWDSGIRANPEEDKICGEIFSRLSENGINVLKIKDVLPDYYAEKTKYFLPHDNHPNAFAHELIAGYLAGLLSKNQ